MAQYKTSIDNIYKTINEPNNDDAKKSEIIIEEIKKMIPDTKLDSQSKRDKMGFTCSMFPNKVVQFICKLGKYKEKICKLPWVITSVISQPKIDKIIEFITTNKDFIERVLQDFNADTDKNQLEQLLENLEENVKTNDSKCISNIKTFLGNLKTRLNTIQSSSNIGLDRTQGDTASSQGETDIETSSSQGDRASSSVENRDTFSDILGHEETYNDDDDDDDNPRKAITSLKEFYQGEGGKNRRFKKITRKRKALRKRTRSFKRKASRKRSRSFKK
jgi:hypothetical protein